MKTVTLEDIKRAQEIINGHIRKTSIEHSPAASQILGCESYFKCEQDQLTGSFKIRGAFNKISSLTAEEKKRGVIAASAGNHAQGVALSATKLGVKASVVMPVNASIVKQQATKNYGAEVILHGEIYDEAYQHARKLEKEKNLVFVHPYEDPLVIAGQGTIGLEIMNELPDVDSIVIPIGGGGLISGIATAVKSVNPKIKIYGAVAENAPAMQSLYKGQEPPTGASFTSIADGIAVKKPSQHIYDNYIKKYVDDILTISEDEIAEAIVFLLERTKQVVEGSGAISLASAFRKKWDLGRKTCIVLSGGNIDLNLMAEILDRGLSRSGRVVRINVVAGDRPGALNKITKIIAELGANILNVEHDRFDPALHIKETKISLILETKNEAHIAEIRKALGELPGLRFL